MARPAALLRAAVLACALLALKDLAFVAPADSPKPRGAEAPGRWEQGGDMYVFLMRISNSRSLQGGSGYRSECH